MIDSISTILGVALGAAIPLLKDYIAGLRAARIEKIKIHDGKRLKAYREALDFVLELRFVMRDRNQAKDLTFFNGCSGKIHLVLSNLVYFSPKVRDGFLEIEELLEHIMENIMNSEENCRLVENKIPKTLNTLKSSILDDFKRWD